MNELRPILCVDDEPLILSSLNRLLRREFGVLGAPTAITAPTSSIQDPLRVGASHP